MFKKVPERQVTTMISYAKYKSIHGLGSGKFYILLDDSTLVQNPLENSIGMEKKLLENSGLFRKHP